MNTLINQIRNCVACDLCKSRKNVVPGEGPHRSPIMIIGEAPGENEDKQGLPFVGKSGKLLNLLLEEAGTSRTDVYITNTVKCRPPMNRNPSEEEINKCFPFLQRQVGIVRPKVIVPLGTFAAKLLTNKDEPISKLRGRMFLFDQTFVIPTFHPAYILRNPSKREIMLSDLKRAVTLI